MQYAEFLQHTLPREQYAALLPSMEVRPLPACWVGLVEGLWMAGVAEAGEEQFWKHKTRPAVQAELTRA